MARYGERSHNGSVSDFRCTTPVYSEAQAAALIGADLDSFRTWSAMRPSGLTTRPTVSFLGLAEAHVLAAFHKAKAAMPPILRAIRRWPKEPALTRCWPANG